MGHIHVKLAGFEFKVNKQAQTTSNRHRNIKYSKNKFILFLFFAIKYNKQFIF